MDVVKISCADLMSARQSYDFVDVRSPSEFERGHVHGAHNIPLFSDQLRALVGTIYVREGKQAALKHALRELGPRLYTLVEQARTVYKDKTLCV